MVKHRSRTFREYSKATVPAPVAPRSSTDNNVKIQGMTGEQISNYMETISRKEKNGCYVST